MSNLIRTEQDGRVVVATLDNPPHALMTMAMVRELGALVADWEQDDTVGAVVLTGAHPDRFLAHFDIEELLQGAQEAPPLPPAAIRAALAAVDGASRADRLAAVLGRTQAAGLLDLVDFQRVLLAMGRSGVSYVAAINGSALGGGCELSLACDVRFMAAGDDHVIGQFELLLGFPPGGGGTQRLARLLGQARALELTLDPQPLTPERAAQVGLVNHVVPAGELLGAAVDFARRQARRSKAGIRGVKRAIREGGDRPLESGLRVEAAEFMAALMSEDALRLMQAYVDRSAALGDLAAYDPDARAAMVDGSFLDLHDGS